MCQNHSSCYIFYYDVEHSNCDETASCFIADTYSAVSVPSVGSGQFKPNFRWSNQIAADTRHRVYLSRFHTDSTASQFGVGQTSNPASIQPMYISDLTLCFFLTACFFLTLIIVPHACKSGVHIKSPSKPTHMTFHDFF